MFLVSIAHGKITGFEYWYIPQILVHVIECVGNNCHTESYIYLSSLFSRIRILLFLININTKVLVGFLNAICHKRSFSVI